MRRHLPLFLLISLLTIANVSSTDYLYAYGNAEGTEYLGAEDGPPPLFVGTSGHLDTPEEHELVSVFKTEGLENVKFEVKRLTKCSVIDASVPIAWLILRIVIDEGPHEGETGWVDFLDYNPDEG